MSDTILEIKDLKILWAILSSRTFLEIKKGSSGYILGPSGCGRKSTLLRCLNGLETIQGGDILLDGQSIIGNQKTFTWFVKDWHGLSKL